MNINRLGIERLFSIGDVVISGGGKAKFKLVKFTEKNIRIQPVAAKTASRLAYDRLSIIVKNFDEVDKFRIEKSVGEILKKNGTQDFQNESYLYGFAREYRLRSRRIPAETKARDSFADLVISEDEESTFPEGAESYKLHKKRERDSKIVVAAKARRFRDTQKLECEICATDFHLVYGELGLGFIEAHHKIPVAQLDGKTPTRVEDLAMVCSNCHRMLHRSGGRTVEELRKIVQSKA